MSYDSLEKSVYSGAPVELYRFTQGPKSWRYTSADSEQTYQGYAYRPEAISRGELDQSQEEQAGSLEVTLPRDNEVASLFIPYLPVEPIGVTLFRFHRGDSEVVTIFVGKVASVAFIGSEARLVCQPVSEVLRRQIPSYMYQYQCNHALYSTACGINKASYKVQAIVSAVSGDTVTATAFGTKSSGWFNNGWLQRSNGEVRFVIGHSGNTVTLMNPFSGLKAGESVDAYAGCDRTESVCASKFGNLVNHAGFSRIPTKNPFEAGLG
jgi:uncharacterized phage protein (TIGR02218 family)